MSTTTQHLGLIQPALSEKHGATTYKTNNTIIDDAYGEYLNNYEQSLENVAPIEGDTASTNYSVGQYIIKDGGLYRVTSSIASGESIVVGTNVIATSLNEAVASLNNTVASINNAIGTVNVATNGNLQSQVSALRDSVGGIQSAIFTVTFSATTAQTAMVNTGIKRKAMIGTVILKSDDVYYCPVCLSVYDSGIIECRRVSAVNADTVATVRSIQIQVFYLPYLNV